MSSMLKYVRFFVIGTHMEWFFLIMKETKYFTNF